MAEATQKLKDLDHDLRVAESEWRYLSEVEEEFPSWDPEDQEVFVLEWAIQDELMADLQRSRDAGEMSAEQAARHDEVKRLAEENRPIIARMTDR